MRFNILQPRRYGSSGRGASMLAIESHSVEDVHHVLAGYLCGTNEMIRAAHIAASIP